MQASSELQHAPVPLTRLRGVGPQVAERLARLAIHSVSDLLFHLPLRYEDRTRLTPIGALHAGLPAVIEGEVQLAEVAIRRRRMLLVRISDGTGALTLRFFHFNQSQADALVRGVRLRCYGEPRPGAVTLEMIHPEYRMLTPGIATAHESALTAIYPATEGIAQLKLRALTDQALGMLGSNSGLLPELLPAEALPGSGIPALAEAVRYVHRPPADAPIGLLMDGSHPAQQRLAFEELLAHHLSLRQLRLDAERSSAQVLGKDQDLARRFRASLPFRLTQAQQRVTMEILGDLQQAHPMLRLVQGDVGCGKTVVAALAALLCIGDGFQAALMAPTELLAEQHYRNFSDWFVPLGIEPLWLSGRMKTSERRAALAALREGRAKFAVGTHALFQEQVAFDSLALAIIDEQHRFGVHQRLALNEKGVRDGHRPHQLIMTATPIPRTLAMTAYADLDISSIDELPPGRTPVKTVVVSDTRRDEVVARVRHACLQGRQVYWVCPLIEESELLQCQAAEETAGLLTAALPDVRVGLIHGRMKAAHKERAMEHFKRGDTQLLVATTVIEVGVDVPNASFMIIENAERLGLSQLHQLRGRVGRGSVESSCVMLCHAPLSSAARTRLKVMRETHDGFEVARRDLELRGPGEMLGTRQAGELRLRIADLSRDAALVPDVQRAATRILERYPERVAPIVRRWLGDNGRYGQA
ncbi:MAG TPA: ATP-dependent DNA helicase RecG [Gammaproteobacteria bacterium]|nr:ATP-dependent DNA helicase RecG [Gammaproteobacteria bacterium]